MAWPRDSEAAGRESPQAASGGTLRRAHAGDLCERGLTQQAVAERSEIPQTHVSDIELGFKLPNLLTVIRLAVALECQVADLTRHSTGRT